MPDQSNNVLDTLEQWDPLDMPITRHGFTEYNRDYRVDVTFVGFDGADRVERPVSYLFRGCVEVRYECRVAAGPAFMDDAFIDYKRWEATGCPDGFVWGVNWADGYPGWLYVEASPRAAAWEERLGLPMHEVDIETNTYALFLVFHDLAVQPPEVVASASVSDAKKAISDEVD